MTTATKLNPLLVQTLTRTRQYRVWDVNNVRMVYDPFLADDEGFYDTNQDYVDGIFRPSFRMDYTNFTDENNIKIFEGDILTLAETGDYDTFIPASFIGVVVFMEGGWFVLNNQNEWMFPLWQEINQWKIVGNVFENPDMLEEIF